MKYIIKLYRAVMIQTKPNELIYYLTLINESIY